jgi:hypothetical protein
MSRLVGISAVMGVFLAAVVVFVRAREWNTYSPGSGEGRTASRVAAMLRSPLAWVLAFFLVVGGLFGAVLVYVGGTPEQQSMVASALLGGGALLFSLYVVYGTYTSGRSRGLPSAMAAMVSAWAFGALFVLAVTVKLLFG